ncbi:MAG: hypothetical protein M3Z15_11640 [Pseudomonadota bacterium]|nr:hypothetical protein [Pseudomonadota bacterium]
MCNHEPARAAALFVHSVIHLTYNRVPHRLGAITLANVALVLLSVSAALHLIAATSS